MNEIIEILKEFDGIGTKAAKRIFFELLTSAIKKEKLVGVINNITERFTVCEICFYYREDNFCGFCDEIKRDKNIICVVSYLSDAQKIYESNYKGLVHVLNGEINLSKNIQPDNLKIKQLFGRINTDVEIILALNLTFEGEVTANYLGTRLKNNCKNVSRIARGIPMGGVLDYIDNETLDDAIINRKNIKEKE